jgi:hypothetical protein
MSITVGREEINLNKTDSKNYERKGGIISSSPKGGCGFSTCNCSPGHWISVLEPVGEDNILRILKFRFSSRLELEDFIEGMKS